MTSDYIEFDKATNVAKRLLKEKGSKQILGLYILTAINTGLRCGDILQLRYKDVIEMESLNLIEGKTKKKRKIALNEAIIKAFNSVYNDRVRLYNEPIFKSNKGSVFTNQQLNRLLKSTFSLEAKRRSISTHSLRKSFGRRVYESLNESEKALMYLSELFSHTSLAVTRVYLGIRDEELQDIYLNL